MTSQTRNMLQRALELTREAPWVSNGMERNRVRAEYAEIHQALRAVDEELRGWKPVTNSGRSAE